MGRGVMSKRRKWECSGCAMKADTLRYPYHPCATTQYPSLLLSHPSKASARVPYMSRSCSNRTLIPFVGHASPLLPSQDSGFQTSGLCLCGEKENWGLVAPRSQKKRCISTTHHSNRPKASGISSGPSLLRKPRDRMFPLSFTHRSSQIVCF